MNQQKSTSKYANYPDVRLKERINELLTETEPFSSVEHLKYLDFFQAGLEYEIRLVEKEEREQKITLYDGVIVSSNTVTTVRFKTDEILMLMVDSPIQIQFPDSKQLEATYIGQDPVNMTVDLTVEGVVPGNLLDRVTILSSSSALLKRLSRRFLEWENGELDREPNHAPMLLNGTFFKPVISSNYSFPELLTLNPEQEDALSRTVDPGIVLLWGPPGTGKTTVLSLSIVNALEQNKRVLLASNTNKAIDHALNKIIDHIESCPRLFPNANRQLNEDLLLRFREIRTDDVYDKLNPRVSLKEIANRKAGGIQDQIEAIRSNLRNIEEQLREAGEMIYELQEFKWNLENLDLNRIKIKDRKQTLTEKENLKQKLYVRITAITEEVDILAEDVSTLRRDEKIYTQLKDAYESLAREPELRILLAKKEESEKTLMKLQDNKVTLVKVLEKEKPHRIEIIRTLEQYTNKQDAISTSIKIHNEISILINEGDNIDASLGQIISNMGQLRSELSEIETKITNARSDIDDLNKTTLSRLRNRSSIRELENALRDFEVKKVQVEYSIKQTSETLDRSRADAIARKSVVNGRLIANKEQIRELIGDEYSVELMTGLASQLTQFKMSLDDTKSKLEKCEEKIKQVEEALPHLSNLIVTNQAELERQYTESQYLKERMINALDIVKRQNASTDPVDGMIIVDERLGYVEANRNKIQQYTTLQGQRNSLIEQLKDTDESISICKMGIVDPDFA